MIETKVEFKGIDQIEAALKVLPFQVQKSVLRRGLRYAAEVFRDGLALRAPRAAVHQVVRRGSSYPTPLADSFGYRIRFQKDGDPAAAVGPGKAFWWGFVERGTRFMRARPFIRQTFDQDGQIAVSAFANGARDELEKVVRRLRRR